MSRYLHLSAKGKIYRDLMAQADTCPLDDLQRLADRTRALIPQLANEDMQIISRLESARAAKTPGKLGGWDGKYRHLASGIKMQAR